MPMLWGKKLYYLLREDLRVMGINLVRDKFLEVLRKDGLLIKRGRRYALTTNSSHGLRLYENL